HERSVAAGGGPGRRGGAAVGDAGDPVVAGTTISRHGPTWGRGPWTCGQVRSGEHRPVPVRRPSVGNARPTTRSPGAGRTSRRGSAMATRRRVPRGRRLTTAHERCGSHHP